MQREFETYCKTHQMEGSAAMKPKIQVVATIFASTCNSDFGGKRSVCNLVGLPAISRQNVVIVFDKFVEQI